MKFEGEPIKYNINLEYTVLRDSQDDLAKIKSLAKLMGARLISAEKVTKKRTTQQNRALHLWFSLLADELNAAGFDMRKTIQDGIDIPWNALTIKEYLWKPVQNAQLKKKSTTDLTTTEIDDIFETINRHIGQRTGVYVDFPHLEDDDLT